MSKIRILKTEKEISKRVKDIGLELTKQFQGEEPVVIGILNGSFMFFSDLIRQIDLDMTCEFLGVLPYKDERNHNGEVAITLDLEVPLRGKHVILVEDLVDTGLTMDYLINSIKTRSPKSVTTVALVSKTKSRKVSLKIDHVGFELSTEDFVVGYGLDFGGQHRNRPALSRLID